MNSNDTQDDDEPLAKRRNRRLNRQLPVRYRDVLPEPPIPLPPRGDASDSVASAVTPGSVSTLLPSIRTQIRCARDSVVQMVKTNLNKFGLYRIYSVPPTSTHDPHNPSTVQRPPANPASPLSSLDAADPYHPYPNKTSFQLGQWYWNQGAQKSKESFRQLLEVINDESFRPEDVKSTNWKAIDRELGGTEEEWLDADGEDEEWHKSTVCISVPFHSRCLNPGPKDYHTIFYHRSLVSVIREKILDPHHHSLFHYDPYELRWQPAHKDQETRVYGDLFSSEAFLKAHRELQASPPEPNCDLPRVVIGLMFASDATQLTTFGSAKLWPLYLFFGNESKYFRSQPSNNLCTHVAYFESVSSSCTSSVENLCTDCNSFQITSKTLSWNTRGTSVRLMGSSLIVIGSYSTNSGRHFWTSTSSTSTSTELSSLAVMESHVAFILESSHIPRITLKSKFPVVYFG